MIIDFSKFSTIKIGSKIDVKIVDENSYNGEIIIGRASNSLVCGGNISILDDKYNFCLLYTSPSPRDRQKSRMPSSA
jgi:UDP-N-acetylmuramate dehydrogenase